MFSITTLVLLLVWCSGGGLTLNCSQLEKLRHGQGSDGHVRESGRGDKFDDFDWAISKEVNLEDPGNIVISPISLKVVLAMLFEGARGLTAQEIAAALDLDISNVTTSRRLNSRQRFSTILQSLQTSQGQYKIKMGTHVFLDQKAEPKELYQCKIQQYYNSALQAVDFSNASAAVATINNWASNATEGHIKDLLSEADAKASTIMLVLNAVYFKGQWEVPFPENNTRESMFHVDATRHVKVPVMEVSDKFGYVNMTDIGAELLRLPYMGGKFAMYVLLPYKNTDLNSVAGALGPNRPIIDYINNMSLVNVNLRLPKFEYDFTKSLKPALEKLGIKTMFSSQAQLPDIAESSTNLVVTDILQKAGISVTEVGTVAYAATVAELADKFGGNDDLIYFNVNRRFLFFIQDESTRTTVFVGKVTNPEKVKVDPHKGDSTTHTPVKDSDTTQVTGLDDKFGGEPDSNSARFNYFDAQLLEEVTTADSSNVVVSPASIKLLLALLLEAADDTTREELWEVMRLPADHSQARATLRALHNALQKSSSDKVVIDSVAQLFVSNKLTPNSTYTRSIKDMYSADVASEDFSYTRIAAKNINQWVSSQTRGFIPSLIEEDMINPETYSILASAIYFEGKWKNEFMPENTKPQCFYSEPSLSCQQTPVMAKTEELFYKLDTTLDAHVLRIPYEDERFAMVVVLPRKRDGMKRLRRDVVRLAFPDLLNNMTLYEVNLKMPRFTIEYGAELINTLKQMGLTELFSDSAKLPFMFNNKAAKVGAVVHKAKIEVTEKGTKAAAASGAAVVPLMYGLDIINVDVDHPFYYFIVERSSQAVLFAGRLSTMSGVTDPPAAAPAAAPATQDSDTWEQNLGGSWPSGDQRAPVNHRYTPTTTTPKRYNCRTHRR